MSEWKAKMFNKKASDPRNKPDQVIEAIGLNKGQSIADIGAGGGYFSLRFAELVGVNGKVYAADINQEFLDFIKNSDGRSGGCLDILFPRERSCEKWKRRAIEWRKNLIFYPNSILPCTQKHQKRFTKPEKTHVKCYSVSPLFKIELARPLFQLRSSPACTFAEKYEVQARVLAVL